MHTPLLTILVVDEPQRVLGNWIDRPNLVCMVVLAADDAAWLRDRLSCGRDSVKEPARQSHPDGDPDEEVQPLLVLRSLTRERGDARGDAMGDAG